MKDNAGMKQDLFKSMFQSSEPQFVLDMALAVLRAESEHPLTAWVAASASRAAGLKCRWQMAADWAERGIALQSSDLEANGWLRYFGGTAAMRLGDLFKAERELGVLEALAPSVPELATVEPKCLFNLAILARLTRRADAEMRYLKKAALLFERQGRRNMMLLCSVEIAWSFGLSDQPDDARSQLDAVRADVLGSEDHELVQDFQLASALERMKCGHVDDAESICRELLGTPGLEIGRRAEAAWIMGCVDFSRGNMTDALTMAELAYDCAWENWWQPRIERIEQLRRAIGAR